MPDVQKKLLPPPRKTFEMERMFADSHHGSTQPSYAKMFWWSLLFCENLAAAIDYKCGYYLNKSSLMAYHCSDVSCICRTRRYQKKTTLDLLRKHWISSVLSIKQVKDVIFKGDTATHVTKGLKDRCKLKPFLAKWQQKHSVSAVDVCYQKVSVWPCDKLVTCSEGKLSLTPTWLK